MNYFSFAKTKNSNNLPFYKRLNICTINMENREGMIPRKEGFAIHEIAVSHLPGGRAALPRRYTEDSRAGVRVSKAWL